MIKPWQNKEGYYDPTAHAGIAAADRESDAERARISKVIGTIKAVADLAGFAILNRIVLMDKETEKEYP